MARLAGYLRVSAVGGRENLRSPEEQREEISTWAKLHGHDVQFLEPELDAKGSNPDRPILREAVDGVKDGTWDGVVVAYLSRAGRDLRLMLDLWDEVEQAGGIVYSAKENVDGSNPTSKMQRNFLASIAQHELEERRAGFERAARGAVERGIWQRRQTPRGYDRDPETRRLVLNDQRDEVEQAGLDFLGGTSIAELSTRLGMTPGGVRAMLRNRVYLGELKVRSYVKLKAHDPIFDLPTFEAIQEKLDAGRRPGRSSSSPSLLAGVVRCRSCGFAMTRSGSKGGWTYRCSKFHSGAVCPGPAGIGSGRLDNFVEAVALRELRGLKGRPVAIDGAKEAEREVATAEAELSAYLQAVDAAGIGSADAAAGMRSRREQLEKAREKLSAEMARIPRLPEVQIGDEIWESLNVSERSDLLRGLFAAVVISPVERRNLPVAERVRIFKFGADLGIPPGRKRDGTGNIAMPWPDLDDPRLVSIAGIEDSL